MLLYSHHLVKNKYMFIVDILIRPECKLSSVLFCSAQVAACFTNVGHVLRYVHDDTINSNARTNNSHAGWNTVDYDHSSAWRGIEWQATVRTAIQ